MARGLGLSTSVSGSKAKENRGKLDARTEVGFVVGYPTGRKGYRIYNPQTCTVKLCIVEFVAYSNLPSAPCVTDPEVLENTPEEWFAWLPEVTTGKRVDWPSEDTTEPKGETGITS